MTTRRSIANGEAEFHLWIKPPGEDTIYNLPITHQILQLYPDNKIYNVSNRYWEANHNYVAGPAEPASIANEWYQLMTHLGDSGQTAAHTLYFKNLGFSYQGMSGIYWDPNWGTTADAWGTTNGLYIFNIYKQNNVTNLKDEMQGLYQNAWSTVKADSYAVFNITHGATANHIALLNAVSATFGGTSAYLLITLDDLTLTSGSFNPGETARITNEISTYNSTVHSYILNPTTGAGKITLIPPHIRTSDTTVQDPLATGVTLTRILNKNLTSFFISQSAASLPKPVTKIHQFANGSTAPNIIGTIRGYTANTSSLTGSITIGYPFFSDREPFPPTWASSNAFEKEIRNGADDYVALAGRLTLSSTAAGATYAFDTTSVSGGAYQNIRVFYPYGYGLAGATDSGYLISGQGILNKNTDVTVWQKEGRETIKYWTKAVFEAIAATCAAYNIPVPTLYVDDNEDFATEGQHWVYRYSLYQSIQTGNLGFMMKDSRWNTEVVCRNSTMAQLAASADFSYLNSQTNTNYFPTPYITMTAVDGNSNLFGGSGQYQFNTLVFEISEETRNTAIYEPARLSVPGLRTTAWKSANVGRNYVHDKYHYAIAGGADSRHQQQVFKGTHQNIVMYPYLAAHTGNVDSEFSGGAYAAEGVTAQIRRTHKKYTKYNIDGVSAGCAESGIPANASLWLTPPGWNNSTDTILNAVGGGSRLAVPYTEDDTLEILKYAYDNAGCKTFMVWGDTQANYVNATLTGTTAGTSFSGTVYHFKTDTGLTYDFYSTYSSFNTGTGALVVSSAIAATAAGSSLLDSYGSQTTIEGMTGYFSRSSTGSNRFAVSAPFNACPVMDFRRLENFFGRVDRLFNVALVPTLLVNGNTYGFGPLDVNFAVSVTGGETVSYSWKLLGSDGPVGSTGTTAAYTYTDPGTYQASVTVNSYGRTSTVTTNIIVLAPNAPNASSTSYSNEFITVSGRIVPKELDRRRRQFFN